MKARASAGNTAQRSPMFTAGHVKTTTFYHLPSVTESEERLQKEEGVEFFFVRKGYDRHRKGIDMGEGAEGTENKIKAYHLILMQGIVRLQRERMKGRVSGGKVEEEGMPRKREGKRKRKSHLIAS